MFVKSVVVVDEIGPLPVSENTPPRRISHGALGSAGVSRGLPISAQVPESVLCQCQDNANRNDAIDIPWLTSYESQVKSPILSRNQDALRVIGVKVRLFSPFMAHQIGRKSRQAH